MRTINEPVDKTLDELIPEYAVAKLHADEYKKEADSLGTSIKNKLDQQKIKSYTAYGFTVTRVVTTREDMNQERLLAVAKKYNLPIIKTVEVIDSDALEKYLYSRPVSMDILADIATCRTQKEIVQLRLKESR